MSFSHEMKSVLPLRLRVCCVMLQSYELRLERLSEQWEGANIPWVHKAVETWFKCLTLTLVALVGIGLVITFTVCPERWRAAGIVGSFLPFFACCLLLGSNVRGGSWSDQCFWNGLLRLALWCKCYRQDLQPLPELTELLLDLGQPDSGMDIFEIPQELSKAKQTLHALTEHNRTLAISLPALLEDVLPADLHSIVIQFVVLS